MVTKTIQITEITVDELADKVADKLLLKIENYLKELSKLDNPTLLTKQEVSSFLRVSIGTVDLWCKKGILNPIYMGNRVLFNKQEILHSIRKKN